MAPHQSQQSRELYVRETRRVTWLGLVGNVLLSLLKLVCGYVGSSQAVMADGVHSLSDSSTDVTILLGVGYWSRPPDHSHPYGHRRIETVVTSGIGVVLMAAAAILAYHAISALEEPHARAPGWIALGAAVVSIVAKEGLYRWSASVGRRIKSPAMIANAWHHRSDAFSSVPVALAVLAARVVPEWTFIDHLAGVVVSVFICRAGWRVFWPALKELVDVGAPRGEVKRIRQVALEIEGVREVHGVRTRYVGGSLKVDLHVLVDGSLSVKEGHEIAERVQQRLLDSGPDVVDAVAHVEPVEVARRSGR